MPPKVARTGGGSKTQPPKKTTTSSSSKSSGSSKTSSSSGVKKSAPPVTSKPKNVDKVDFGKPKPTASAGTYKPTPPKPSKAEEIARIAAEKRAESLAEMPSLVRKANEAFENWQKAVDDVRMCQHDLTRAQKKAEERREHPMKNLAIISGGIMTGGAAGLGFGEMIAEDITPTDPITLAMKLGAAPTGVAIGMVAGGVGTAKELFCEDEIKEAESSLADAKKEEKRLQTAFNNADFSLKVCIVGVSMSGTKPRLGTDDISINYPTSAAALRSEFKI